MPKSGSSFKSNATNGTNAAAKPSNVIIQRGFHKDKDRNSKYGVVKEENNAGEVDTTSLQRQDIIQLHKHIPARRRSRESKQKLQQDDSNERPKSKIRSKSKSRRSRSNYPALKYLTDEEAHNQPRTSAPQPAQQDSDQQIVPEVPEPPQLVNMYIHDKYALKYSLDQLNLTLRRQMSVGQLTGSTGCILFLIVSIMVDYLNFDFLLLRQSTYKIVTAYDFGLVANLRAGEVGWPILLVICLVLIFIIKELLQSKSFMTVAITLFLLFCFEASIVLISISKTKFYPKANETLPAETKTKALDGTNLLIVGFLCVIYMIGLAVEILILTRLIRRMQNHEEYPKEATLIKGKDS